MSSSTKDDPVTHVAKALANYEQTPFGMVTMTKEDGSDPVEVDTRSSYRREAKRFLAMLKAANEALNRP